MKDIYVTLKSSGEAEFEEKKSRFIGCAAPISTEEEALAFIKEIKNGYMSKTQTKLYKNNENSFVTLIKRRNGLAYWETIKLS